MSPFKYHFVRYQMRNAMRQGKLHEVELLLLNEEDTFDWEFDRNESPLYLACTSGNKGLVDIALKHAGYLLYTPTSLELRETYLHIAAESGFEDIVEMLLQRGAEVLSITKHGITPLHLAALGGHEGVIRLLIKYGANVKDKDTHGFTALHMACIDGHCELVRVLIEAGANVNEPSINGIAPLHIAAEQGRTWMVRELIEWGAEVDVLTRGHLTSLDCAVINGQIDVVTVLIELGASLNGNRGGCGTPLHHAIYKQDYVVVEILLNRGAKLDLRALRIAFDCNSNADDRILLLLLARRADATQSGITPLQLAFRKSVFSPLTIMTLLEYGTGFPSEDEILKCYEAYGTADVTERRSVARKPLEVFDLFFTKLQTADLCSPDDVFLYPPGLYPTLNRDLKEKYRRVCAAEVLNMKKKTIGSSGVSFYDFLIRTDAICRNDEVTDALPKDFRSHFPHYGQILNVRTRKALQRRALIDLSYSPFARLMKFNFPNLVTDHVFTFLSDQDLKNMIEVCKTLRKPTQGCCCLPAVHPVLDTKCMASETNSSSNNNNQKRQSNTLEFEEAGGVRITKKPRSRLF